MVGLAKNPIYLPAVVALLVFILPADATTITGCTVIDSPGYYSLANDIIDSNSARCIEIKSNDVILDGQNHVIDGIDSSSSEGIYAFNVSNVTVKNLIITDWGFGIVFLKVKLVKILNNTVSSNNNGIIVSYYSSGNKIIGNNVSNNNNRGIGIVLSNANAITKNVVTFNDRYGVHISYSRFNRVTENEISHNGLGVYIGGSLFRSTSDFNTVAQNNISANDRGISIVGSYRNTIKDNIIASNQVGLSIGRSSGNTIYNNYFNNTNSNADLPSTPLIRNKLYVYKTPGTNIVGGPYIGGNYWGKPDGTGFSDTCSDSDSDGICDSQYVLTYFYSRPTNIDKFPLTRITPTPPTSIPEYSSMIMPVIGIFTLIALKLTRRKE